MPGPIAFAAPEGETPMASYDSYASYEEADPAQIRARWDEWARGGPVTFAGEQTALQAPVAAPVGVIVRLDAPIELRPVPWATWQTVQRLNADPFGDLALAFAPRRLDPGKSYEMRLIARDKTSPTSDVIRTQLEAIGFSPVTLHAIRRNMRLPGRPNTSVSLWWATGTYRGPTSYTSPDDALFVETLTPSIG